MNSNYPSKAQLSYAEAISTKTNIPLPEDFTMKAYWTYISQYKNKLKEEISTKKEEEEIYFQIEHTKETKANLSLYLNRVPKNCGECPFWENTSYYDEDAFYGSGEVHSCPFGGNLVGCLVERPKNCPIHDLKNKR